MSEARVLDPELAQRVAALSIRARLAVEGLLSGSHRSPHRGASVVFVEHRDYRPGDEPRLIDWRAYARSDRHVVKRFEQESQLRATLVLDASGSMGYGEPGATKHDVAATLLAGIAFVLVRQGDSVGTVRVADQTLSSLPPRSRPAHLNMVLAELALAPVEGTQTNLEKTLREVAERAGRRGLVVLASDLLDLSDDALSAVDQLVHRGNDVWVLQVMHPDELDLPFRDPMRFIGLEGEGLLEVDPESLREAYLEELNKFLERCRAKCTAAGARHRLVRTDERPERVLAEMISASRGARASGAGRR